MELTREGEKEKEREREGGERGKGNRDYWVHTLLTPVLGVLRGAPWCPAY